MMVIIIINFFFLGGGGWETGKSESLIHPCCKYLHFRQIMVTYVFQNNRSLPRVVFVFPSQGPFLPVIDFPLPPNPFFTGYFPPPPCNEVKLYIINMLP